MSDPARDPKDLVDDPRVPEAVQRELIAAWAVQYPDGEGRQLAEIREIDIPDGGGPDPKANYDVAVDLAIEAARAEQTKLDFEDTTTFTGATADAILDVGAIGLQYFERFLPLALRVHPLGVTVEDLRRRYDEQRGVNLEALACDAEIAQQFVAVMRAQAQEQSVLPARLGQAWEGRASDDAQIFLRAHADRADRNTEIAAEAAAALGHGCENLRDAVRLKAKDVSALYAAEIDGRTALAIAAMVEVSTADRDGIDDRTWGQAVSLVRWFPETEGALLRGTTNPVYRHSYVQQVGDRSREWLRGTFVPHVREHCTALVDHCDAADQAVRETYEAIQRVLSTIDSAGYPEPGRSVAPPISSGGVPSVGGVASGGVASGGPGTPGGGPYLPPAPVESESGRQVPLGTPAHDGSSIFPSPGFGGSGTPAASPIAGLAALAQGLLGDLLTGGHQQGLGLDAPVLGPLDAEIASGGVADAQAGDVQTGDVRGADDPAGGPLADRAGSEISFASNENSIKVSFDDDGDGLRLTVTEADGQSKTFGIGIGADGVPAITGPLPDSEDTESGDCESGDCESADCESGGTESEDAESEDCESGSTSAGDVGTDAAAIADDATGAEEATVAVEADSSTPEPADSEAQPEPVDGADIPEPTDTQDTMLPGTVSMPPIDAPYSTESERRGATADDAESAPIAEVGESSSGSPAADPASTSAPDTGAELAETGVS